MRSALRETLWLVLLGGLGFLVLGLLGNYAIYGAWLGR